MNLKLKTNEFEIELTHADHKHIEPALLAIMSALNGPNFIETYYQVQKDVEELKALKQANKCLKNDVEKNDNKTVKNYIEPVDGVRTHENGVKEYKCSYSCTCGHSGVRYVHEDAETTTCHKCKTELTLMAATLNDAHDKDFNYFLAM